jgi:hypothetical protein
VMHPVRGAQSPRKVVERITPEHVVAVHWDRVMRTN